MKNKIFKGLLSLILITMALPAQSQDFMNIYLKSGEFRKFYMKNVTEISASKYDAAGVQHSDYEYQIIKTVNEEFIYNLQDVDSITFTSIDEEQAIESFVSAIKEISPIIESCESIEEIESRIDDIKSAKGVEKAWSDGHVLSVRTTGGETITFHKSHHNNADEENASIKKAVKRIIMSAQKFALIKNNKDIRCAIVNQPHNDNSYNLRRDNIILPTQNILNQYGVKTDYIPNPTLDFFYNNSSNPDSYNLYDYDFVILLTHGSYDYIEEFDKNKYDLFKIHEFATSEELGKKRFNVLLDSDEKILHNKLQELRDKYNSTDYEISLFVCDEERDGKTYFVYYAGVTESFFINSAKGKFKNPNSVLFNSACESLKGNKNFATIFRDKRDLGVYLGYDESDAKGEVAAYYLVTGLLNSSSLEMAYENIPDQIKNEQNEDGIISHLKRIPETDNNTNGLFLVKPYTVAVTQEDMDNAINNGNVINIEGYVSYCDSENGINVGFKYGFDKDNLTEKVPTTSSEIVSNEGLGNLKVTTTLSNLQHGKTYYYRVFTTDGKYDSDGDICTFKIDEKPSDSRVQMLTGTVNNATYSIYKEITDESDYHENPDGWKCYRSKLTLDITKNGTTNTYVVDDNIYLDKETQHHGGQVPCMMLDYNKNKMYIFCNSKDSQPYYSMDGNFYSSSIDKISFSKETVFEGANFGWYPYFRDSGNDEIHLCHFSYAGYFTILAKRNTSNEWTLYYDNPEITPEDAIKEWEQVPHILVIGTP